MLSFANYSRHFSVIIKDGRRSDKELLEKLEELIFKLRATNSINAKVEVIKSYPKLLPILNLIHSPHRPFHIKSTSLTRYSNNDLDKNEQAPSLSILLESLADRKITGKEAVLKVARYINEYPEHEEVIKNAIDKNIKARVGADLLKRCTESSLNIACSLGYPIEKHSEYFKKSLNNGDRWFSSRKYDGIRTFLKYNHQENTIELMSRQMKPISGLNPTVLDTLKHQILNAKLQESFILDGELVYIDEQNDSEDFSKTVSIVKSKEPKPIDDLQFKVFDCVESSQQGFSSLTFSDRQSYISYLLTNIPQDIISLVNQTPVSIESFDYEQLLKRAVELGYEGFIIRKDSVLKSGRSRDLLKLKPWLDDEFEVIGHELGFMRIINESGMEQIHHVLSSIMIKFNDNIVHVGSGFTNSERIEFAKDPSKILNKVVTIKYQNESKIEGRSGNSLRFPIFKYLHGNERNL